MIAGVVALCGILGAVLPEGFVKAVRAIVFASLAGGFSYGMLIVMGNQGTAPPLLMKIGIPTLVALFFGWIAYSGEPGGDS